MVAFRTPVAERGPRSGVESNERRASLVYNFRLSLRENALTKRTFAERKATIRKAALQTATNALFLQAPEATFEQVVKLGIPSVVGQTYS